MYQLNLTLLFSTSTSYYTNFKRKFKTQINSCKKNSTTNYIHSASFVYFQLCVYIYVFKFYIIRIFYLRSVNTFNLHLFYLVLRVLTTNKHKFIV